MVVALGPGLVDLGVAASAHLVEEVDDIGAIDDLVSVDCLILTLDFHHHLIIEPSKIYHLT